ncbi:thioredoxin domain-containing protein [Dissulfurirhabdus thermomarina]|uniref:thioredoxin domain-containing protein n=1 Tax=Dissulfurirhabdus thermomarina TaxID=1765737 RepID=UPI00142EFC0C|nr:thioredoxin domain-containing protein [Dissulfurirhabdus thermomarina]NMX23042.1 thioredoxin domain-containing protein [Dissulfurirhabdus thermomarina]
MPGNRLARAHSPYLLAHAGQPVDWYPWCEEAFRRARMEDRPVFLSIGYAACHWCHVMSRESFDDPEVAAVLNETFVNVKVDREERPDVDAVYMEACRRLTGGGGWPLTVILTPDGRPFFAATYLPKASRGGRIGLLDLARHVKRLWATRREPVLRAAAEVTAVLAEEGRAASGPGPDAGTVRLAVETLYGIFDRVHGGFGEAPKFPSGTVLSFLVRHWRRAGDPRAREMADLTLRRMRRGGIFDQVGLGFHRYSTDGRWFLPHFEKMLTDQALLATAYAEAAAAFGEPEFARTAREVFTYVLRDLAAPEGGFFSSEDADVEGEEGRYTTWTEAEIRAVLPPETADALCRVFGVEPEGNYAEEASGRVTGRNVLAFADPGAPLPGDDTVARGLERLAEVRARRRRPRLDDKVLADWNGLMIEALATGARVLGDDALAAAAVRAADFVLSRMRGPGGRLLHRWHRGAVGIPGFLDDYVFVTAGLIALHQALHDSRYLAAAVELQDILDEDFRDEAGGGYHFTSADGEPLLVRRKDIYDGAVPSGNAVAAGNLLRLARLTGEPRYEAAADALFGAFGAAVRAAPAAAVTLLDASAAGSGVDVVVAGEAGARELVAVTREVWHPDDLVVVRKAAPGEAEAAAPPFAAACGPVEGRAAAYVCSRRSCRPPVTDPAALRRLLAEARQAGAFPPDRDAPGGPGA